MSSFFDLEIIVCMYRAYMREQNEKKQKKIYTHRDMRRNQGKYMISWR